ncbi:DMT family transporter [Thorsellia anophelis]|uniref:Permease of the drug/metabolite transporter (DMT) superfamily n=1 Tax=Thorsellia anophelis DSM 18579 TaxID=1123402 RepID=A0A1I0BMT2_9GAMM|nr:DMT family transporter [Thorsellia anophelis]SET07985.1 Permease of the drug/metabolite transporter (DMT) superfamily [Thorsellia anophelis DSM 18579]
MQNNSETNAETTLESNNEDIKKLLLGFSTPEICLIAITILWGGTFLIVKHAMLYSGPFFFVGLRFSAAALALLCFSYKRLKGLTWYELKAGMFIGFAISLGYGLQTVGLQTIPSSTSAFITALYVPFVPILQWLILRRLPGLMSWIGIISAFIGLFFLTKPEGESFVYLSFSIGEILTIFSALAIALEIILISHFSNQVDSRRVTLIQLLSAAIFSFTLMIPTQESLPNFSPYLLYSAIGLGVMSALIQFVMNWAQKSVSPTRATLIYAGEPVWAGIVGRIAGEKLSYLGLFGGALILFAVLISELPNPFKKNKKNS